MITEIAFFFLAAVILFGALKVVSEEEPVHAAIYLGAVLMGVAGIYLTIGAEFLAAIQVLIYVGAVTTLILFAVMLTTHASPMDGFAEDRTPLSTLGIDAPKGMDVEAVEEVPEDVETVDEAEAEADREGEGYTVTKEGTADSSTDQPSEDDHGADEAPGETAESEEADAGDEAEGDR